MELQAPVIPSTTNMAEPFLKGFALMAAYSHKRQQDELAMQKMQNAIIADQSKSQIEAGKQDLEKQRLLNQGEHYKQMYDLGSANNEFRLNKYQNALTQDKNDTNRLIDYQNELYGIDAQRGTEAWQNQANLIKSKYSDVTGTIEGGRVWRQLFDEHKWSARDARNTTNDIMRNYYGNLKSNGLSDYAFANPNIWGSGDGKKFLAYDANGLIVDPKSKAAASFKTLPMDQYNTLQAQHDRVKDILSSPDARPADTSTGGKQLDEQTAKDILNEAGGDNEAARQLARDRGYTF